MIQMKIHSEIRHNAPLTPAGRMAVLVAVLWAGAMGWLFLFSAVDEPPLPPPQIFRFWAHIREYSLPGLVMALIPEWCLLLDYQAYRRLPSLTGWLKRYGIIIAPSLVTAFWIFSQRVHSWEGGQGYPLFYVLLGSIFCLLSMCRKPTAKTNHKTTLH